MDLASKAGRLTLAGVVMFAKIATGADAGSSAGEGRWSAAAAPVLSIQPEGHAGSPYLSKPLGGSPWGLAFVVQRRVWPGAGIALEASSALAISDAQTGRFILAARATSRVAGTRSCLRIATRWVSGFTGLRNESDRGFVEGRLRS